jgi:hypothetical protein
LLEAELARAHAAAAGGAPPSARALLARGRGRGGRGGFAAGALETLPGVAVRGGGRVALAVPLPGPLVGAAAPAGRRALRPPRAPPAAAAAAGGRAARVGAPDAASRAAAAAAAGAPALVARAPTLDVCGAEAVAREAERRGRAAAQRIAMESAALAHARVGAAEKRAARAAGAAFGAIVGAVMHARLQVVAGLAFQKWASLLALGDVHAAGVWQAALVFTEGSAQLLGGLDALREESVGLLVRQPFLLDRLATVRARVDGARREALLVEAELAALARTPALLIEAEASLAHDGGGGGGALLSRLGAGLTLALETPASDASAARERLREAAVRGSLSRELLHLLAPPTDAPHGAAALGADARGLAAASLAAEQRLRRAAEAEAGRLQAQLAETRRRSTLGADAAVAAAVAAAEARHSRERRLRETAASAALAQARAAHAEERLVLATALAIAQAELGPSSRFDYARDDDSPVAPAPRPLARMTLLRRGSADG